MATKITMKITYCPLCNREHALERLGRGLMIAVDGKMTYFNEEFYKCTFQENLFTSDEHLNELLDEARKKGSDSSLESRRFS
ncbi:MAG: hypothetical protein II921_07905 [Treponema sp.]|nr:hypothetical protein [Treponema sp.]